MKFKFHIAHQVPGRIRLKVALGKRNPALLDEIKQLFATVPGIGRIAVNPTTGSLILHYDRARHLGFYEDFQDRYASHIATPPPTEVDSSLNMIQAETEFLATRSHAVRTVVDFCKSMDQSLRVATNNTIDLKIAVAAGFAGLALVKIGVTASTPMWVTLAIFALNHMAEMNLPDPARSVAD